MGNAEPATVQPAKWLPVSLIVTAQEKHLVLLSSEPLKSYGEWHIILAVLVHHYSDFQKIRKLYVTAQLNDYINSPAGYAADEIIMSCPFVGQLITIEKRKK